MLKKIKNYLNISIVLALSLTVLGLTFIIFPNTSFEVICYFLAGVLVINGGMVLIFGSRYTILFDSLFYGLLSFIFGLIILIHPDILKVIMPILLGIWFILNGFLKVRLIVCLKEEDKSYYYLTLIMSIISIVCGIIMVLEPVGNVEIITISIGIILMTYAISDIINLSIIKRYINKVVKYVKNNYDKFIKID